VWVTKILRQSKKPTILYFNRSHQLNAFWRLPGRTSSPDL